MASRFAKAPTAWVRRPIPRLRCFSGLGSSQCSFEVLLDPERLDEILHLPNGNATQGYSATSAFPARGRGSRSPPGK